MQIRSIQVLRAVAAIAVVASHAIDQYPEVQLPKALHHLGHAGVDLFFVISGFLMMHLHQKDFGEPGTPGAFLTKRLIRIMPIYWLLSAFALALALFLPQLFDSARSIELDALIGNFLFIPWPDSAGEVNRLLVVGWTLDYEMYFYLLFAVAMMFRNGALVLFPFLIWSVIAGRLFHPDHPWLQLVTSPLLLEFTAGMAIALIAKAAVPRFLAWSFMVAALAWLALATYQPLPMRILNWGVPAVMIVLACVWLRFECQSLIGRALVVAGDASYSIYLVQVFALPAAVIAIRLVADPLPVVAKIILAWGCACLSGVCVWRLVERPITRALRAWVALARESSSHPTSIRRTSYIP